MRADQRFGEIKRSRTITDLHKFQRPVNCLRSGVKSKPPLLYQQRIAHCASDRCAKFGVFRWIRGCERAADIRLTFTLLSKLEGVGGRISSLPSLVRRSWLQSDFEINYYYNPRVSPTYVSTSVTSVTRQETRTETGREAREKRETPFSKRPTH